MADAQPTSATQVCKHCGEVKPLADYWNPVSRRHARWCSVCLPRRRAGTLHCIAPSCDQPVYCRGMCRPHYERARYPEWRATLRSRQASYYAATRDARRATQAAWNAANREKKAAGDAAWRAANSERKRVTDAANYAARKDEIKLQSAARYAANKDKLRDGNRAWRAANPASLQAYQVTRRARKRGASGRLTPAGWRAVLEEFGHACAYCHARGVALQQEHMTPLSRGGRHDSDNVVPACGTCNTRKNARTLLEFAGVELKFGW